MNVLAIGAHYDDIEIGCGGTIARHVQNGDNVVFLTISHSGYESIEGQKIRDAKIAKKESEFLNYLTINRNRTVSKEELTQNLWSFENMPSDATLRVYIRNLRAVIGKTTIETIRGMGYRLVS